MPTYDVKVRFRGLCPFVPGADLDKGGQPQWVGSFLVNANRDTLNVKDARDLPEHLPCLRFKASDLEGQKGRDAWVLHPLEFEDVVFLPPAGTKKSLTVNFAHNPAPAGPRPQNGEERLFNWVTRMSDVMPGRGKVDRDCFEPQPKKGRVVARVHIDHGLLETDKLGRVNTHVVVSQLGSGPLRRATARKVLLTMPCEAGSPFRIKTRQFRIGDPQTVRELVFRDPGAGNSIELEIVNLCVDDLLFQRPDDPESWFRPDSDFRANYLLSSGVSSLTGEVPMPLTPGPGVLKGLKAAVKKGGPGGGGSDASQCSPPRTDPASAAAVGTMQQISTDISQK